MEYSEKIVVAIIAASVSILVSIVGFFTNRFQTKISQIRFEKELKNKYTNILYEKRIELYPAAFKISSKIKKIQEHGGIIPREQQLRILKNLNSWVEDEAGLFLSKEVISAYYNLRKSLGNAPGNCDSYTKVQIDKIWNARNDFRIALRNDISNLHRK
jgi:hypothetical protein